MADRREASPDNALTFQQNAHADNQVGQQHWYDKSHDELVHAYRSYIQRRERLWAKGGVPERGYYLPHELIFLELDPRSLELPIAQKQAFFMPLAHAWRALTYDLLEPGSGDEQNAGRSLSRIYQTTGKSTIELSDLQTRVIDALTVVANVPHQTGTSIITIPENLRHYDTWSQSKQYQNRVASAHATRTR